MPDAKKTQMVRVATLPIHDMLHAVWEAGELVFGQSAIGAAGPEFIETWWRAALSDPAYKGHPALQNESDLKWMLPIVIHMDGGEVFNNVEFYNWSWSVATVQGPALDKCYPILSLPAYCMLDPDIKHEVMERVGHFIGWCVSLTRHGIGPLRDYYNDAHPPRSFRANLAGKPIAGPWKACFAGFKVGW